MYFDYYWLTFADDLVVVVTGKNIEQLEHDILEAISKLMKMDGLELKTEVVVLKGKRNWGKVEFPLGRTTI